MFREKYRRDNELLRAPDKIPEGVLNMTKENLQANDKKYNIRTIAAAVAACLVVALLAALPILGRGRDLPLVEVVSTGDLHSAADYDELYSTIMNIRKANGGGDGYYSGVMMGGFGVLTDGVVMEEAPEAEINSSFNGAMDATAAAPVTTVPDGASADDLEYGSEKDDSYSHTNTQKENVDEADIIKTDGNYIYRLTNGEIVIIDPTTMTVTSRIENERTDDEKGCWFYINDIYVSGSRLVAMYNQETRRSDSDWQYDSSSGMLIYDITDRAAPVLIGDCAQSGYLASSRLIGNYVYMITTYGIYSDVDEDKPETFVPVLYCGDKCEPVPAADICILEQPSTTTYAVISSVNINDASEFASVEATFGNGVTVYADTERIILACSREYGSSEDTTENGENVTIRSYTHATTLINFAIDNGAVSLVSSGEVPGSLLNQFSLDRHNGVLRAVTTLSESEEKIYTDGIDRYEWNSSTTNGLYTLDDSMTILGSLDGLAEDERVYSVRFSGDIGYFVTFRQVDPLFAVDLSDPAKPTLLSALKIPGFSQYLHPYADGLLFGLGMDADEETGRTNGMKLSMFDITDPADVTEKHKLLLPELKHSEALYNHKAILISASRDIIAFPAGDGYVIYGCGDDGFYERNELTIDPGKLSGQLRGLFIGNSFYICSDHTLLRFDITTFAPTGELTFSEPKYTTSSTMVEELIIFD